MPNERKINIVNELRQKLHDAKGIILTSYAGLAVPEVSELRTKLRNSKSEINVVKNTLLQIALKGTPFELKDDLQGPTAMVISKEEEISPIKVLYEFSKEHEALKVKGGFFEGQWTAAETLTQIAKLPSKAELVAKVLNMLQSPMARMVNVAKEQQRALISVLIQIGKTQKTQ